MMHPPSQKAWRGGLLWFDEATHNAHLEGDALMITQRDDDGVARIVAMGPYASLKAQFAHLTPTHWPDRIMAPGFVDMHVHYPQLDVVGSPADGLLPWLTKYTFVEEAKFSQPDHAHAVAQFFLDELLGHGVTTAVAFASSHPASVHALFTSAQARQLRLITGKVLQDQHSPNGVRDQTEQSLLDTEALIQRWHGVGRLGYAITPRFVPTCSTAQLHGAGELAAAYPSTWIQSHVAENLDEIRWVRDLYPQARSYLSVYDDVGLLRERAVYAHCIHFDDEDYRLMQARGACAAISPTSNLFLGSGFFDYARAQTHGMAHGLASDVGGGTSFSPFHTMLAAYQVARVGQGKTGLSLSPENLWWQHTAGAAQALGLAGQVGNLQVGYEADFVLLNPRATPLLARRTAQANTLAEWLFAMIVLGDDRVIAHTVIQGDITAPRGHESR